MKGILLLPERPTAVFAGNDHLALGAYWAVQQAGLRVPEDMSIIGFDGLGIERMVPGNITTVRQPGRQIGREAGHLLVTQMREIVAGGQPRSVHQIHLRGEIAVGVTTAPTGIRSSGTSAASVTNINGASGRQAASSDCSG
jgi:LacI family transcriptional regulator